MSFGGSQRSENISSSSFVNIFHESEYIDRRKRKSKNRRNYILLLLLFLLVGLMKSLHSNDEIFASFR